MGLAVKELCRRWSCTASATIGLGHLRSSIIITTQTADSAIRTAPAERRSSIQQLRPLRTPHFTRRQAQTEPNTPAKCSARSQREERSKSHTPQMAKTLMIRMPRKVISTGAFWEVSTWASVEVVQILPTIRSG